MLATVNIPLPMLHSQGGCYMSFLMEQVKGMLQTRKCPCGMENKVFSGTTLQSHFSDKHIRTTKSKIEFLHDRSDFPPQLFKSSHLFVPLSHGEVELDLMPLLFY